MCGEGIISIKCPADVYSLESTGKPDPYLIVMYIKPFEIAKWGKTGQTLFCGYLGEVNVKCCLPSSSDGRWRTMFSHRESELYSN